MTEWRDATAFVLPTAPPRGEQWLRGLSHSIGFRSDGYVFEEREAILHGEWGELGCRTQLVDDPAGTLL
ncbi:MAG: hypothetical protein IRZ07_28375, partial [Microbispora sp.]|nr:hypothetical protein [Microbispora sp.]